MTHNSLDPKKKSVILTELAAARRTRVNPYLKSQELLEFSALVPVTLVLRLCQSNACFFEGERIKTEHTENRLGYKSNSRQKRIFDAQ